MSLTEQWRIDEMFLEVGVLPVRPEKVALLVVVKTDNKACVLDGDDEHPPADQDERKNAADYEDEVVEHVVNPQRLLLQQMC